MTQIGSPMNVSNRSAVGMDKFNKAPPGWSLTEPKGKWAWEKPPVSSTPAQAVDKVIDRLEEPNVRTQVTKLMVSGISIQEIVNTVAIAGFSQGEFTPDVAEIIKGPLAAYLMGMAAEEEIPVKVYNTDDGLYAMDEGMSDDDLMDVMKDRNPDLFKFIQSKAVEMDQEPEPMVEKGFIGISPEEVQEEELI
tara:strand:- start:2230 stop:2805 length:576 start_codon:yes stop_codon:yes gene_type:complete